MPTILVAEDSGFTRRMITKELREAGYTVLEAENGQEALSICHSDSPDCVVTDLLMPVMGGVEFLRNLRATGSELPVIVSTADIQQSSLAKCQELGISGFLNKPVRSEQLLPTLEGALTQAAGGKL